MRTRLTSLQKENGEIVNASEKAKQLFCLRSHQTFAYMKVLLFMCITLFIGCKAQKVNCPTPKNRTFIKSVVYKIDTLQNRQCLYATTQYLDSIIIGDGSIITKCGCFLLNEEVNHDCIRSSQ